MPAYNIHYRDITIHLVVKAQSARQIEEYVERLKDDMETLATQKTRQKKHGVEVVLRMP